MNFGGDWLPGVWELMPFAAMFAFFLGLAYAEYVMAALGEAGRS